MPPAELLTARLHHQKLIQSNLSTPADVVLWMGAVQAQDFPAAKWPAVASTSERGVAGAANSLM